MTEEVFVIEKTSQEPVIVKREQITDNILRKFLEVLNLDLYYHQAVALNKVLEGENVAITTPTASGKSLIYQLAFLREFTINPNATALYIAPLNALINDQEEKMNEIIKKIYNTEGKIESLFQNLLVPFNTSIQFGKAPIISIFTGQVEDGKRNIIKQKANLVFINPEELVHSVLFFPDSWQRILRNLRYIILDEAHTFTGIFGTHMANALRILKQLIKRWTNPQYIVLSATLSNEEEFLERLTGEKFFVVSRSGSPRQSMKYVVRKIHKAERRPPSYILLANLVRAYVDEGKKVLAFGKSRALVEKAYKYLKEIKKDEYIAPYRSGYSTQHRKQIETAFKNNLIKGIIATSALELGIDIGDLDVVIVFGFPLSKISLYQMLGRAGRKKPGIGEFIPSHNVLDEYYADNPNLLFNDKFEEGTLDFLNKYIVPKYMALFSIANYRLNGEKCIPFKVAENIWTKDWYKILQDTMKEKIATNYIRIDEKGQCFYSIVGNSLRTQINLRAVGKTFIIYEVGSNKKIGKISSPHVYLECYPGAVYLHMGESYRVVKLDVENQEILVEKLDQNRYTEVLKDVDINILEVYDSKSLNDDVKVFLGNVNVKESYKGYVEYKVEYDGEFERKEYLKRELYDIPLINEFNTKAIWLEFKQSTLLGLVEESDFSDPLILNNKALDIFNAPNLLSSGLHGAEHIIIAMYPLFIRADRTEIGGMSTFEHIDIEYGRAPRIFIYEAFEGGVGYSEKAYEHILDLVTAAFDRLSSCACDNDAGCPACIQSPKCGNANKYLSKIFSKRILSLILGI